MDPTFTQQEEALFRHAVLGPVLAGKLRRGQLRRKLEELASETYTDRTGEVRKMSWKTLEQWFYQIKNGGFTALTPKTRSDAGTCRALSPELVHLVIDLKLDDPGQSARLIKDTLIKAGRIGPQDVHESAIQRLLKRRGLSGPKLELARKERHRWCAATVGELAQSDCAHAFKLFNPVTRREETVKIFAILDDKSRMGLNIQGGFRETEAAFLAVMHGSIARRGKFRTLYVDRGSSYMGRDLELACAHLGIRLLHAPVADGPSKGKIERFWRTLRADVLDRIDPTAVRTIEDLNVRLMAWMEGEYNVRPHSGLSGRTPREVWEEEIDQVAWIDDPSRLDAVFTGEAMRKSRNDATVSFEGKTYELPAHLRRCRVTLKYSFLDPSRVRVLDGTTEVPLKIVDPIANATRTRHTPRLAARRVKKHRDLNPVEVILDRVAGRTPGRKEA